MELQSLWVQIPEILGIPLVCLLIITLIKAVAVGRQIGNDDTIDIAMDLSIMATGACGSIFANDTLLSKWGLALIIYGILTALLCICFMALFSYIKRFQVPPISGLKAFRNLFLGLMPVGLVTSVLILGYTVPLKR